MVFEKKINVKSLHLIVIRIYTSHHTNPATPQGNLTFLCLFVLSCIELLKLCTAVIMNILGPKSMLYRRI